MLGGLTSKPSSLPRTFHRFAQQDVQPQTGLNVEGVPRGTELRATQYPIAGASHSGASRAGSILTGLFLQLHLSWHSGCSASLGLCPFSNPVSSAFSSILSYLISFQWIPFLLESFLAAYYEECWLIHLQYRHHLLHFTDKETEARGSEVNGQLVTEVEFKLRSSDLKPRHVFSSC